MSVLKRFSIRSSSKEKAMVSFTCAPLPIERTLCRVESIETPNARNRRRSYGALRKNIRQLFQSYPRLARSMKRSDILSFRPPRWSPSLACRGLYLVSVMLNGERILVTNEEVLPMVEVDENYGHNLLADFQWFMKLTFVWDDLKNLRPDLQRCLSVTSFYLRIKLVQAAIELQVREERCVELIQWSVAHRRGRTEAVWERISRRYSLDILWCLSRIMFKSNQCLTNQGCL